MDKKLENFLIDLSELTKKYQIVIGGCGCCGSPYLDKLDGDDDEPSEIGTELTWNDEKYIYETREIIEEKERV